MASRPHARAGAPRLEDVFIRIVSGESGGVETESSRADLREAGEAVAV